ncbi:hypothetical protein DXC26_12615 [Clostridiaceae bacterium OM08-6BH]|nr:hypothetical protein DXC26_12615 [Clostridiaceae bacterium OM08-6BH]
MEEQVKGTPGSCPVERRVGRFREHTLHAKERSAVFLLKDMHSMRVVPREIELIRPVPEYLQYSETGFFCASNEPGRSEPEA